MCRFQRYLRIFSRKTQCLLINLFYVSIYNIRSIHHFPILVDRQWFHKRGEKTFRFYICFSLSPVANNVIFMFIVYCNSIKTYLNALVTDCMKFDRTVTLPGLQCYTTNANTSETRNAGYRISKQINCVL